MANLDKYKEQARKYEMKEQWPKAIDALRKAIELFEESPENDSDLALYNRAGDLYVKQGDTANAIAYYERAVDKYEEAALLNNAIALCNKLIRLSPGRASAYLKLGMLFARKGFMAEAKQNLLEYADRMQKAGQLGEAFKALRAFAEMSPEATEIWKVLAEQARAEAKTPEATEQVEQVLAEFEARERGEAPRKSRASRSMITGEEIPEPKGPARGELVFLDLDEEPAPRASAAAPAPPKATPPPAKPSALVIEPTSMVPEAPPAEEEPLELEPTSLADEGATELEIEPTALGGIEPLEIETTSLVEPEEAPSADLEPLELEPTSLAGEAPALELEPTSLVEPPAEAEVPEEPEVEAIVPELLEFEVKPSELAEEVAAEPPAAVGADLPILEVEEKPAAVDLPMLDTGEVEAVEVPETEEAVEEGAEIEFLDLGAVESAAPTVDELESRLAADPSDWAAHRLLGEALIEKGERDRGLEELDASLDGYEEAGSLDEASSVLEEILRVDRNSVRHYQKRVELAFRSGDRERLVDAYVELGDALLRADDPDRAVAVYQRVLEHDAGNVRAKSALDALMPAETEPEAAPVRLSAAAPEPADDKEYVDLGALLFDEEGPKDTRMRVEDEEPSGDEEKDFRQMLAAFKKGIADNVGEEDFQSHYDLGVAYKEMGLLDEAISEFQKALRATEGRLKSSEALGLCFFEKGQFAVAEAILRRGVEVAGSDAERVGLLYWLGRSMEQQGRGQDALAAYNRVFAVDIDFQDVNDRVTALSKAGA